MSGFMGENLMNSKKIAENFKTKVAQQSGVHTFFDNVVVELMSRGECERNEERILTWLIESRENRFCKFDDRKKRLTSFTNPFHDLGHYSSQGTHSVLTWKGLPMFKSVFDMAVYMMILHELKPQVIIEYGSGNGASALWLADMCSTFEGSAKFFSYDIKPVSVEHPNITFKMMDLANLELNEEETKGRKLIIEDAHNHVKDVLLKTDQILNPGDYLVVEDSCQKQDIISDFIRLAKNNYLVDNYYTDFFGINMGSTWNSILRVA